MEFFAERQGEDGNVLVLRGAWVMDRAQDLRNALRSIDTGRYAAVDATGLERMDTWGAMVLRDMAEREGLRPVLSDAQKQLFQYLPQEKKPLEKERKGFFKGSFIRIGKAFLYGTGIVYGVMSFIGEVFFCFLRCLGQPRRFRFHSIVRHIEETGLRALPIIGLLAILISMVISYQGATQLQKFGASIFTIDLTVISLLREMGVLVTAIMVAGRSGSAFAAEIGVMKLREEIDALKTIGMDPIEVLVMPRLIAMMMTLPVLAFLADIIGLAGGAVISTTMLDIPLEQYINRVDAVATPTMFFVGMVKAPVFAFIITIIGAYQGMNVTGSAESVGKLTTLSVVQSIFLVIMADALFSIFFASMGI
jgi:phospholipid/cholesterol/gamma-HCH transport system permease protein